MCRPCISRTTSTVPGATQDDRDSHAAALAYVDGQLARLWRGDGQPWPAVLRHRLLRPRHGLRRGRAHRPPGGARERVDRTVRAVRGAPMLDRLAVPGLPLRVPAQDGVPPAGPAPARCATSGPARIAQSLFLYLHVPFCEMRCGFCNLFTRSNPPAEQVRRFLDQLRSEAKATKEALGRSRFVAGADRRRHTDLPDRGRAARAVRHRGDHVRRATPASRGDLAGHGHSRSVGGAGGARNAADQHRRAELPRRTRRTPPAGRNVDPMWTER